jgi:hypothetical protein
MNNINKTLLAHQSLRKEESEYVIFQLLIDKKIRFEDICETYTQYLEKEKEKSMTLISRLAFPLSHFFNKSKNKTDKNFKKQAAKAMLESNVFEASEFETMLKKYIVL